VIEAVSVRRQPWGASLGMLAAGHRLRVANLEDPLAGHIRDAIDSPEVLTRRIASARKSGGYGGRERGTWAPSWEPGAPSGQVSTKAGQVQTVPNRV